MQLYRQTAIFCLCQAVAGRQGGGGHIATGDAGPGPPAQPDLLLLLENLKKINVGRGSSSSSGGEQS